MQPSRASGERRRLRLAVKRGKGIVLGEARMRILPRLIAGGEWMNVS
jgi:hypothetical protein